MSCRGGRERSGRRRRRWRCCWTVPPAIKGRGCCRRSCLCLLPFLRDHDANYDDNDEQQYEKKNNYNYDNDPDRETRFLFAFSFSLLTALDEPVDFRVLRKESLYIFKLRDC